MLVNQGAIGIQYWTGVEPEKAIMRATLERALGVSAS
jgi:shikimate dehydrogenase